MTRAACLFISLILLSFTSLLAVQPPSESEGADAQQQKSQSQIVNSQAQETGGDKQTNLETLKCWENRGSFNSILDMHNWYARELQRMTQNLPHQQKSIQLLTAKSTVEIDSIPEVDATRIIRMGIAYHMPLNTTNFHFGLNAYSREKSDFWVYGVIGGGSKDTKVFRHTNLATAQLVNDRVASNIGLGADWGYRISQTFYGYLGFNMCNVFMKHTSNGSNFNPYLGLRIFTPLKTPYYYITADIKVGKPYWSGFSTVYGNHGPFLTGGITLLSRKPFGIAQPPRTAPLETSLFYSPAMSTIVAKFAYPIRIYEQLSIAPTIHLGTDARTFQRLEREVSSYYSGGLDVRLYGDELDKFLNPYVSYNYYFIEYDELGANIGEGHLVHVGNRFSLGKKFYLDVFTGPNFINRRVRQINSTGHIPSLSSWDIGAGITYSFGVVKPKKKAELSKVIGSYKAYCGKTDDLSSISRKIDLATQSELNEKLRIAQQQLDAGEKNFQVKLEEERTYGIVEPEEPPIPNYGDLTDLKFFKVDLGLSLGIDKKHAIPYQDSPEELAQSTLFIALFDKEKIRVDLIDNTNMFLHFVDLDSGRYFGYRYDRNRRMQPDSRDGLVINRKDMSKPIYYGKYEDYVRQMEWLKGEDIAKFLGDFNLSENVVADLILKKMNSNNPTPDSSIYSSDCTFGNDPIEIAAKNYQIAYVKYPTEIVKNVENVCSNYGATLMFRFDMNNNFRVNDSLTGHFLRVSDVGNKNILCTNNEQIKDLSPNEAITTDFSDCSFFSNIIPKDKFSTVDIYRKQFTLSGFKLCETSLLSRHYSVLSEVMKYANSHPRERIRIFGSADGTTPTPDCQNRYRKEAERELGQITLKDLKTYTNKKLGEDRARAAQEYLINNGIPETRFGEIGSQTTNRRYRPEDRSVIIDFR